MFQRSCRDRLLTDGPAGETLDGGLREELAESGLVVKNPGLVHEADFAVPAVDLTGDDLLDDVLGLAALLELGGGDFLFVGDRFGRDFGGVDVWRQVFLMPASSISPPMSRRTPILPLKWM